MHTDRHFCIPRMQPHRSAFSNYVVQEIKISTTGSHVYVKIPSHIPGDTQVLPDAVHRGGRGFNDSFFDGEIQPIRAPLDTLFDVEHLVEWGASVDTVLHTVRGAVSHRVTHHIFLRETCSEVSLPIKVIRKVVNQDKLRFREGNETTFAF